MSTTGTDNTVTNNTTDDETDGGIGEYVNAVHHGDAFELLDELPDESVHAVVTDPPYNFDGGFMGEDWDDLGDGAAYQRWCQEWGEACLDVLKPGGHLLAFGSSKQHHRLFCGIEDAGFEIRDTVTWHYGSGFPKASDISKTIDKRADADRETIATRSDSDITNGNVAAKAAKNTSENTEYSITAPATDPAKQWDGFKTALKPATEFVVLARKPFTGACVDAVLEHGTGALNIDACRVDTDEELSYGGHKEFEPDKQPRSTTTDTINKREEKHDEGRYPANVIFDEHAAEQLDEQVGELDSGAFPEKVDSSKQNLGFRSDEERGERIETGSGGPSRYFYTSKASKKERTLNDRIDNPHPTVKPQDLMEHLVKLVTAEQQIVLDPFTGSGTTLAAAGATDRRFIGIEQNPEYVEIARARADLDTADPSLFRDDGQDGLEHYF